MGNIDRPQDDEFIAEVTKSERELGSESKKEQGPESFRWVDIVEPSGHRSRAIEFPSGNKYLLHEYTNALFYHLHQNRPLPDIPTTKDLISLFGSGAHSYQDTDFLELAYRQSPEEFLQIIKHFEESVRIKAIVGAVADFFVFNKLDGETKLSCDGNDMYWFDRLDPEECRKQSRDRGININPKFSPSVRDAVTRIYLRFAPPVGSLKYGEHDYVPPGSSLKWEVDDYLVNENLRQEFADEIPNIGRDLMDTREQAKSDPISAIKSVFSHLPAYNAGKMGAYIGNAVLKFRDRLSKEELIGFVESNDTIGEFDKKPLITAIERAFAANDDSARIKGDMSY